MPWVRAVGLVEGLTSETSVELLWRVLRAPRWNSQASKEVVQADGLDTF